jgi:hypothetical protein
MIEDLWYKNAVVYSLDLETLQDADGDGVGDFEGLVRRLDYLQGLGVDVLWLAPFQPTPNRDNGYDISDYYGVDPRHGSSGDFVEATGRAVKVPPASRRVRRRHEARHHLSLPGRQRRFLGASRFKERSATRST